MLNIRILLYQGQLYRSLSRVGWGDRHGKERRIARELLDPSPPLEAVLDTYIKPHKELLQTILIGIIGLCLYYALAAPVIKRITGSDVPIENQIDRLSEFVRSFSPGAIARIVSGAEAVDEPTRRPLQPRFPHQRNHEQTPHRCRCCHPRGDCDLHLQQPLPP